MRRDQLVVEDAERPVPGPAQALVRVRAAAITRDELQWPVERLPAIPSYELSGVVEEVGGGRGPRSRSATKCSLLTLFDRDGVAADYSAVSAELLVGKPRTLEHAESAAIPLPALSAWQGLFDHGRLETGQRVLIHGAAGAVGAFAVQLARSRGAHVIGSASAANLESGARAGRTRGSSTGDPRSSRTRSSRSTSCSTPPVGTGCAGLGAVLSPGGRLVSVAEEPPDGGVFFIVEPDRDQLEIARRGWQTPVTLRPPPRRDLPARRRRREAFARSLQPGRRGKVVLVP